MFGLNYLLATVVWFDLMVYLVVFAWSLTLFDFVLMLFVGLLAIEFLVFAVGLRGCVVWFVLA